MSTLNWAPTSLATHWQLLILQFSATLFSFTNSFSKKRKEPNSQTWLAGSHLLLDRQSSRNISARMCSVKRNSRPQKLIVMMKVKRRKRRRRKKRRMKVKRKKRRSIQAKRMKRRSIKAKMKRKRTKRRRKKPRLLLKKMMMMTYLRKKRRKIH